jgi:hypothetical protein
MGKRSALVAPVGCRLLLDCPRGGRGIRGRWTTRRLVGGRLASGRRRGFLPVRWLVHTVPSMRVDTLAGTL